MYPIESSVYEAMVSSRTREIGWHGTISLKNGDAVAFDNSVIKEGTGTLQRSCSDESKVGIGDVYASQLALSFLNMSVNRYKLYKGIIHLYSDFSYDTTIPTWGDLEAYTWEDIGVYTWGTLEAKHNVSIPMGLFIIEEVSQTANMISVVAYDYMTKFDKNIPNLGSTAKTPFGWLNTVCSACGVTLASEMRDIYSLPNGRRLVKFSNTDNSIKTYRDVITAIVAMLGANAMINRQGQLVVQGYTNYIADVISPDGRYSSNFSDYQVYYSGLTLNYVNQNAKIVITNSSEDGLVYDLGSNPFLQIDIEQNRTDMLQAIIDAQEGLVFTPFQLSIPFNPCYDLMDTLLFTGNQATEQDVAPITNMTIKLNGKMDISCGGENPALVSLETQGEKTVSGLSGKSSIGDDLWLLMGNAPATTITIPANTETQVGEIPLYAKEANSMIQIAYTATYTLSASSLVTLRLVLDSDTVYTVKQVQEAGYNKLTATTGYEFSGEGEHTVKAYITVSSS